MLHQPVQDSLERALEAKNEAPYPSSVSCVSEAASEEVCQEYVPSFQFFHESVKPSLKDRHLTFKMSEAGPQLLREILHEMGWSEEFGDGANLHWKSTRFSANEHASCDPAIHRLNHFSGTSVLTRKDNLWRMLKTMRGIYSGKVFDFFPETFTLPNEYVKFVKVYAKDEETKTRRLWICKPVDASRGRGIFLVRELKHLTYDTNIVVQAYVDSPLLISGYKFDLRVYVVVRSFNPLVVYLYDEGMARFATCKYDTKDIENVFSHLTNTSINKFSPSYNNDKDEVGPGCKWMLSKLVAFLKHRGIKFERIWSKVQSIVLCTLLPIASDVSSHSYSCFELFGFDVIVDQNLKPWLLEINLSPALSVDSSVDVKLKKPLLMDMISLTTFSIGSCSKKVSSVQATKVDEAYFPERLGGFKRIYPFDARTRNNGNVRVGQPAMRSIIQSIKKKCG